MKNEIKKRRQALIDMMEDAENIGENEHWDYQGKTEKQVQNSTVMFIWLIILAFAVISSYAIYHVVKEVVTYFLDK